VRDEDRRERKLDVQLVKGSLEAIARQRIERTERLVEQHDARIGGQRSRYADPLSLPSGKGIGCWPPSTSMMAKRT
jgi:hypothetical protein